MDFETEGFKNLHTAESLLVKAKVAETDSEIQNLIFVAESSIKELFSSSYPNKPNPAVHKTLNNVLNILNDKNQKKFNQTKFSFTKIRDKPIKQKEPEIVKSDDNEVEVSSDPEFVYYENCIIKNMKDKRIFRFLKSDKMGYTSIENIENSELVLLNVVESSFISNVKNSVIWLSISNSSVMVSEVYDSVIVTCSRQLRVTNCKNVRIFINSVTPPTIEMSSNITFSLNHLTYNGFEDHLKMSELRGEISENLDSIKDFSWHHPEKSPNWNIIEKKSQHMTNIIKLEHEDELNKETFSEIDWKILKTL